MVHEASYRLVLALAILVAMLCGPLKPASAQTTGKTASTPAAASGAGKTKQGQSSADVPSGGNAAPASANTQPSWLPPTPAWEIQPWEAEPVGGGAPPEAVVYHSNMQAFPPTVTSDHRFPYREAHSFPTQSSPAFPAPGPNAKAAVVDRPWPYTLPNGLSGTAHSSMCYTHCMRLGKPDVASRLTPAQKTQLTWSCMQQCGYTWPSYAAGFPFFNWTVPQLPPGIFGDAHNLGAPPGWTLPGGYGAAFPWGGTFPSMFPYGFLGASAGMGFPYAGIWGGPWSSQPLIARQSVLGGGGPTAGPASAAAQHAGFKDHADCVMSCASMGADAINAHNEKAKSDTKLTKMTENDKLRMSYSCMSGCAQGSPYNWMYNWTDPLLPANVQPFAKAYAGVHGDLFDWAFNGSHPMSAFPFQAAPGAVFPLANPFMAGFIGGPIGWGPAAAGMVGGLGAAAYQVPPQRRTTHVPLQQQPTGNPLGEMSFRAKAASRIRRVGTKDPAFPAAEPIQHPGTTGLVHAHGIFAKRAYETSCVMQCVHMGIASMTAYDAAVQAQEIQGGKKTEPGDRLKMSYSCMTGCHHGTPFMFNWTHPMLPGNVHAWASSSRGTASMLPPTTTATPVDFPSCMMQCMIMGREAMAVAEQSGAVGTALGGNKKITDSDRFRMGLACRHGCGSGTPFMFNWTMPDMPGDPSAYALNPYLGSQPFVHAYWLSHPPKNHAECVMQCLHMGKEAMAEWDKHVAARDGHCPRGAVKTKDTDRDAVSASCMQGCSSGIPFMFNWTEPMMPGIPVASPGSWIYGLSGHAETGFHNPFGDGDGEQGAPFSPFTTPSQIAAGPVDHQTCVMQCLSMGHDAMQRHDKLVKAGTLKDVPTTELQRANLVGTCSHGCDAGTPFMFNFTNPAMPGLPVLPDDNKPFWSSWSAPLLPGLPPVPMYPAFASPGHPVHQYYGNMYNFTHPFYPYAGHPNGAGGGFQSAGKGHVVCIIKQIRAYKAAKPATRKAEELANFLRACAPYVYVMYGPKGHSAENVPKPDPTPSNGVTGFGSLVGSGAAHNSDAQGGDAQDRDLSISSSLLQTNNGGLRRSLRRPAQTHFSMLEVDESTKGFPTPSYPSPIPKTGDAALDYVQEIVRAHGISGGLTVETMPQKLAVYGGSKFGSGAPMIPHGVPIVSSGRAKMASHAACLSDCKTTAADDVDALESCLEACLSLHHSEMYQPAPVSVQPEGELNPKAPASTS